MKGVAAFRSTGKKSYIANSMISPRLFYTQHLATHKVIGRITVDAPD